MIEVSHLSKKFGEFRAVDDISFSIPTGQIVGLLGPNGAGKTTTMRMICGFFGTSGGSIKIDGVEISENPIFAKRKIGYMPESAPLYSDMIVEDYLNYVAQMQGADAAQKIPELCKTCGLKEVMHKSISELSRGYRQRVGLAHALMNDPEILILDEPTSGLESNRRRAHAHQGNRQNANRNNFHAYSRRSGNALSARHNHRERKIGGGQSDERAAKKFPKFSYAEHCFWRREFFGSKIRI